MSFGRLAATFGFGSDEELLRRWTQLRVWVDEEGLPARPWYRNLLIATDPDTGYGAWQLPLLRHAARGDAPLDNALERRHLDVRRRITDAIESIDAGEE